MTVARRLQSALAGFVVLIAAVVAFQVRTIRAAANSGQSLAEISSRLRTTSTDQLARLAQMGDDAEKYVVTRDAAYLERATESARVFGTELARLNSLDLTPGERSALVGLAVDWRSVAPIAGSLDELPTTTAAETESRIARFQASLNAVAEKTRALGAASQAAMSDELMAVDHAATSAERLSLGAAIGALVLMILVAAHLVRAIIVPLGQLAEGTRQVSAGRFDHRLRADGDDELAQVARDFNSMTGRLDELDRLKREFVAKVSHDLKTPLSSMQETTSALLDGVAGDLSDQQRRLLSLNLESNVRLSAMLTKLLDLSHLEAGLEPSRQRVDLKALAAGTVDRLVTSRSAPRLQFVASERPLFVSGDPGALAQVLDNLIENALKFSPPGGTVVVHVDDWTEASEQIPADRAAAFRWRGAPHGAALVSVTDEGPGIPDAEKERVFGRFYQTEAGRAARGRGVGLGLAICREIVSAHDGIIWVMDHEPRGSVFLVLLPTASPIMPEKTAEDAVMSVPAT